MAIVEMFCWWYSRGWLVFIQKLKNYLSTTTDFFSMDSLVRTLFQPYRQISAVTAGGSSSLDLKFHMFLDRLVSRMIGFISRLFLLVIGTVVIVVGGVVSLGLIILWPVTPLLPIAGIALSIMGVTI